MSGTMFYRNYSKGEGSKVSPVLNGIAIGMLGQTGSRKTQGGAFQINRFPGVLNGNLKTQVQGSGPYGTEW